MTTYTWYFQNLPVFSQSLWNLRFIYRVSMTNSLWWQIISLPLEKCKRQCDIVLIIWYKIFVHWKLKFLSLLMDFLAERFEQYGWGCWMGKCWCFGWLWPLTPGGGSWREVVALMEFHCSHTTNTISMCVSNREEKLRYVTMVAKVLELNEPWSCKYGRKKKRKNWHVRLCSCPWLHSGTKR